MPKDMAFMLLWAVLLLKALLVLTRTDLASSLGVAMTILGEEVFAIRGDLVCQDPRYLH